MGDIEYWLERFIVLSEMLMFIFFVEIFIVVFINRLRVYLGCY